MEGGSGRGAVGRHEQGAAPVVEQALHALMPAILSVWVVDTLASVLTGHGAGQSRPHRRSRFACLVAIAGLPLLVELVLRTVTSGSTYPVVAWLAVYAVFAAYLMISSSFIWTRLIGVAPSIEDLLDGPARRADVASWIEKKSKRLPQVVICLVVASVSAVAMGLSDHRYPSLRISVAWYFSTWLTLFIATDAVSWVLRFIALTARLRREEHLIVSTFAPVRTPAVQDLRDFAATVASVTGVGLFFFVAPLVWAVAYVLANHESAASLRLLSIAPAAGTSLIAIAAVFAPQFFIASFVGRERDGLLQKLDGLIPKRDPLALLDHEIEQRVALFNSIAATGTTSTSMSALTRRSAGLLVPLAPLLFTFLATVLGFTQSRTVPHEEKNKPPAVACVVCGASRPALALLPANIQLTPAITKPFADAEPLIGETTSSDIAKLALRYQPTVKMSIFDRFWPVSAAVALNERGNGRYTCLVNPGSRCEGPLAPSRLSELQPSASSNAYLDYPEPLNDMRAQFTGFTSALGFSGSEAQRLWGQPAEVDPYPWAQLYFFFAGKASDVYKPAPPGLISLQYWLFYAFNYYPSRVTSPRRMLHEPIAADRGNLDYHEGDWEHVTVLLDPKTLAPQWLWMARHSDEGTAIPWSEVTLDGTHPVIYPALGGHPSYQRECRAWRRRGRFVFKISYVADYVGCDPAFFTFDGATTPLVDLSHVTWACWPGHFGKAGAALRTAGNRRDPTGLYLVAGPRSPLRQAENADAHTCGSAGRRAREASLGLLGRHI